MLPVVAGEPETRKQIFLYTLLLIGVSLLLFASGTMGYLYLVSALVLGGIMLYLAFSCCAAAPSLGKPALLVLELLPGAAFRRHGARPHHRLGGRSQCASAGVPPRGPS